MSTQNSIIEYKDMDVKSLEEKVRYFKRELSGLLIDKNTAKLKDLKSLSKKKKEVARMLTIINQKKMLAKLEKGEQ